MISTVNPNLDDIPQISKEMKLIENELMRVIEEGDESIRGILKDFFAGGKRLRPKLVLLSGLCFSPVNTKMIYSAVAAELIHTASLIHDDVIDRSDYRRNRPTINYVYGNHTAVLAGDYIFAKAFEVLCRQNLNRCMGYLVEAIQEMCTGEIIQARESPDLTVDEDRYFRTIEKKTASLIAACCKSGADCGKADEVQIEKMGLFGLYLGYAFQIVDDILDITGDTSEMGKPVAHDLEEGKITLPYIYFLRDRVWEAKYRYTLMERNLATDMKYQIIRDLKHSGAITKAYAKAEECVKKAKEILNELPDSIYKQILADLSEKVMLRKR
ncbi:polyprenyl synthetase family protein [Thermosediminibacter oceani]|uniref:Polyprenyl synthetase n=1 Tax=Thermosediminibacter oceani (strain ATCC BAA-1034 / DSM 16646 / JW/IW-1228P) TaxID=555079 RepID=D9RY42_THEOJ|nr:polyprenyl synthetase family protein [Thermosediminibacter oceani]ADL08266.1 Polyprenyl synthetase [Thermosediminibacter oceani DSM 16646]